MKLCAVSGKELHAPVLLVECLKQQDNQYLHILHENLLFLRQSYRICILVSLILLYLPEKALTLILLTYLFFFQAEIFVSPFLILQGSSELSSYINYISTTHPFYIKKLFFQLFNAF